MDNKMEEMALPPDTPETGCQETATHIEQRIIPNCPPIPCPECDGVMHLQYSERDVSQLRYFCENFPDCRSTHGAYADGRPLGVPADRETRLARIRAHQAFNALWTEYDQLPAFADLNQNKKKHLRCCARRWSYRWLSRQLGIPYLNCHIGAFDLATCDRVVTVCQGMNAEQLRDWVDNVWLPRRQRNFMRRRTREQEAPVGRKHASHS